jgi:hypothetical protein
MGTALIGALLPQWPIGRLSDTIDRRQLVYRIALISTCLSAALAIFPERSFVWVATLVYVALTFHAIWAYRFARQRPDRATLPRR